MTPLDEAPEQRWRRTVDRRNRPAKLKVDRLLRDFGYAELDSAVGDAIEARLAGVALAVAPSLRDAVAGEVVTLYANDTTAPAEDAVAPAPRVAVPVAADESAGASDVAQMVTYLKQQVLDARAEAERLRTELDRRSDARMDAERENEAIIAEQAAALEAQTSQIAELAAALDSTRRALAETRDEIRRAVGELQALPEPVPADTEAALLAADDEAAAGEDATDDYDLGEDEWAGARDEAEAAAGVAEPLPDEPPDDGDEDFDMPPPGRAAASEDVRDEPGLTVVEPGPELEARDASAIDLEAPAPITDEAPVAEVPDPLLDLDEPALGAQDRRAQAPDRAFDLDEPALGAPEPPGAAATEPSFDLDDPAPPPDEFDIEPRPRAAETPVPDEIGDWQPEIPPAPRERESEPHAAGDPDGPGTVPPPAQPEPADELDVPLPSVDELDVPLPPADELDVPLPPADEWLPADLRSAPDAPGTDAGASAPEPLPAGAGEPEPEAELTDFDDFLYDAEELYDPGEPERAGDGDGWLESEIEARWPDEPVAALPPPPPAPPSPFGEELAPEPPAGAERATRGKVLRGRAGRARGRWEGSCSICGREPQVNRRKDLQAAGWDLDDDAAACPQCRGVG